MPLLDCGHNPDKGQETTVDGKPYHGWTSRLLDDGSHVCTACYCARTMLDCGHHPVLTEDDYLVSGYGNYEGKRICFRCCGEKDKQEMIDTGKHGGLYLTRGKVSNWPGSLLFPVHHTKEWKGWRFGRSYPVRVGYFTGPDSKPWSIKVQGNMDCGRAKRLKGKGTKP